MKTAKVFSYDEGQAVKIPEEYRFSGDEILVNKIGDIVMLLPKESAWNGMAAAVDMFSDDFMEDEWKAMQEKGNQERTGDAP